MKSFPKGGHLLITCAAVALVSGCGGSQSVTVPPAATSQKPPLAHIVVIVQENRTFNNLFAGFPGATTTMTGTMIVGRGKNAKQEPVALKATNLNDQVDLNHLHAAFLRAYDDGQMDAFNQVKFVGTAFREDKGPYQYVKRDQIKPYWELAAKYALADEMFQTQGSASFTAHQDLVRGGTAINSRASLIDLPTGVPPWGCDAASYTQTDLITTSLRYEPGKGPFPCLSYATLQNLLDAHSVSWKYYTPSEKTDEAGSLWNAFLAISSVYHHRKEWKAHISSPNTSIFSDISQNALPAMSWVIPDGADSDHPAFGSDTGPSWVAQIVNAIGQSPYWSSTAIVIVWDDWGGFYDPVKPPKLDNQGGPGFRVPMIVVSPFVPENEISHTFYEFGSIVRFIEDNWQLGRLNTTDETSASIANIFDFNQSPRPFQPVASKYDRGYFLSKKPSYSPVDNQ
ncbi:MAG: hypothetical protein JO113_02795 [Candidatus Eremiobacteraeota bacterium]|nr:hypothetical protein [Candidatus Eremiobacteraeota bacterium]